MDIPSLQNSLDHGYSPLHRHTLALDHATDFIRYFDRSFIVGEKQGFQDCFEIINNPLPPRSSLQCRMASELGDEIVNDVSFLSSSHGFASTERGRVATPPHLTASIALQLP